MFVQSILTSGPESTKRLGYRLASCLIPGDCIPLIGDMGSGKTCFVQGVADGLDVPAHIAVNSPSFTLANRYTGRIPLYHVDLFRLENAEELTDIEIDELIHSDGVTLIEWPQVASSLLIHAVMTIEFVWEMTSEMERRLTFSTEETRFLPFLNALKK